MWRYLFILIITALLSMCCCGQALAIEVIAGKVVTVDRENRKIVLVPLEDGKGQMVIEFERGRIPPDLKTGEIVRIKGNFSDKSVTECYQAQRFGVVVRPVAVGIGLE
ncbi:MAG: hypothetical protein GWP07_07250 [Xanthomonadaceae bacterium]|nr:hypothetical protein [Xanthomonadaceae bacterium]